MQAALRALPLAQLSAVIDLHQDNFIPEKGSYYYYYPPAAYAGILAKVRAQAPVFCDRVVDSGQEYSARSDASGGIVLHDGTLPDLCYHLGARHCLTVETTTATDPAVAQQINLAWIYGVIDLLAS